MLNTLYRSRSRQATWLELFFDLVFVAVIGVITHDLAHTHHGHIGVDQLLRFPLVFIPVWWIWTTHTLYANRFDDNDRAHRLFALVIMALLVFLSTYEKDSQGENFLHFTLLYSAIRVLLAILYLRIHSRHKTEVFYAGIAVDMGAQLILRKKTRQIPVDRKHLAERIGLLVIIILGESVISMISSLSNIKVWDNFSIAAALTGFTMVWAIWWIYFDSFSALERAKRITDGNLLIYSHLIVYMGLLILANLIGHSIKRDLDQETFRMLAITGMCGFYFGKQIVYMVCFPPFRKIIIINTILCISITVASTYLPRIEYSLVGMTLGMLFYVYSNYKWLLPNNIDAYVVEKHH